MNTRTEPRHYGAQHRTATKSCQADGCSASTREGKPFCPDHVEKHGYVQNILMLLQKQDEEIEKVAKQGSIRPIKNDSLTAKELVQHIHIHGARTLPRLSREFQIEEDVLTVYARYLVKNNRARMGRTSRGSKVLAPC